MFDESTDVGRRVKGRLEAEGTAWLTTVREDGMPQPVPVWFLWDGETFLIYSQPEARKVKNIRHNPHVSMNLNSDAHGGDIVRATGVAEIEADAPLLTEVPAYIEKYRPSIHPERGYEALGMSEEEIAKTFCCAIRIRPDKWWMW